MYLNSAECLYELIKIVQKKMKYEKLRNIIKIKEQI